MPLPESSRAYSVLVTTRYLPNTVTRMLCRVDQTIVIRNDCLNLWNCVKNGKLSGAVLYVLVPFGLERAELVRRKLYSDARGLLALRFSYTATKDLLLYPAHLPLIQ